jgi:hypothetical protein
MAGKSRQRANIDMATLDILGLGAGPKKIDSLADYLYDMNTKVGSGAVYGFVGDPSKLNIAVLPYGANNVEIVGDNLKINGVELDYYKPTGNLFGSTFEQNTIVHQFHNNTFTRNTNNNYFGEGFSQNRAGRSFYRNKFGASCFSNIFGDGTGQLEFGSSNSYNIVGDNCTNIKTGYGVVGCNFGNKSEYITVGNNCRNVIFINCKGTYDSPLLIPDNSVDVTYKNNVLTTDPYGVSGKLDKAANLSDVQDKKVSRFNLGITDGNDKILPSLIAGGIDEINDDYPTLAALQAAIPVGLKSVLYITTDQDLQFRWSGTAYRQFFSSPGTTDSVTEGAINKYFTAARAIGAALTGYVKANAIAAIAATDSILVAFGKLEKKADDNTAAISDVKAVIPVTASSQNTLVTQNDLAGIVGGPKVFPFVDKTTFSIKHGRGRLVGVQLYENDGILSTCDVKQDDLNNVTLTFGDTPISGNVLIL